MGCEHVIDRREKGYQFWKDEHTQDEKEWRRLGKDIRSSSAATSRWCSSTPAARPSAPRCSWPPAAGKHHHLRRHLRLHDRVRQPPPLDEAEAHRLVALRQLQGGVGGQPGSSPRARSSRCCPVLPLEETGAAALAVHKNEIEGKAGVLCLAPEKGLGIDDPEFREKVGEDKITLFPTTSATGSPTARATLAALADAGRSSSTRSLARPRGAKVAFVTPTPPIGVLVQLVER
jgi:crotonyl-CoA reductase